MRIVRIQSGGYVSAVNLNLQQRELLLTYKTLT